MGFSTFDLSNHGIDENNIGSGRQAQLYEDSALYPGH